MKGLLVLIGLAAIGVFFFYPLFGEDTGSECDAFERLAVRLALTTNQKAAPTPGLVLGQLLQGLSKGQFARVEAQDRYPNVPVTAACAVLYWRAVSDPDGFRHVATGRR